MIGQLQGRLLEKYMPTVLLDVQGVGYEVELSLTSFYRLPATGESLVLHTHLIVREDAKLLYGFCTREERAMFRELIKINGVGPKSALAILSGIEPDQFVHCVQSNNAAALMRLPGVGKKTAERLLVELRDRVKEWKGVS